jgi:hypothetical protein
LAGTYLLIASFSTVALHTAVTFFVLALGILFARANRGLMAVIWRDSIGVRRCSTMSAVVCFDRRLMTNPAAIKTSATPSLPLPSSTQRHLTSVGGAFGPRRLFRRAKAAAGLNYQM